MKDFDNFIIHLKNLIACKSVKDAPQENMPFGEGVFKAYDYFMTLAKDMTKKNPALFRNTASRWW
jgi:hypothetical protein